MSADINITPFTDVVLVLLIVFMVATPAMYQSSLKVELPQGSTAEDTSQDVVIAIDAKGDVYLDEMRVELKELQETMRGRVESGETMQVIVDGDRNVKYDHVVQVMDALAQAGVKNPGLGIELKR
jgi:biopolymer transport protein ExbD